MALVGDFNRIEHDLPDDWAHAHLRLTVTDPDRVDRAAAQLGPANPGRVGGTVRFTTSRRDAGLRPDGIRRLLQRLDDEGIHGTLELVGADEAPIETLDVRPSMRADWEHALSTLPPDWSDVYAEVRLDSTDYLEPAALYLSPLNPLRVSDAATFRFRCARTFGYGVAPETAARCFERCDEEGLTGGVQILRALSDTYPVGTQGPVWYVGGRTV